MILSIVYWGRVWPLGITERALCQVEPGNWGREVGWSRERLRWMRLRVILLLERAGCRCRSRGVISDDTDSHNTPGHDSGSGSGSSGLLAHLGICPYLV